MKDADRGVGLLSVREDEAVYCCGVGRRRRRGEREIVSWVALTVSSAIRQQRILISGVLSVWREAEAVVEVASVVEGFSLLMAV
jgi:hypothetical protein